MNIDFISNIPRRTITLLILGSVVLLTSVSVLAWGASNDFFVRPKVELGQLTTPQVERPTLIPIQIPTLIPEPSLAPSASPVPTPKPTVFIRPTAIPIATLTPTLVPTSMPTLTETPTPTATSIPTPTPDIVAVFVGAGDIASCASSGDEATANLLDGISGTVFTTGDNVYNTGTAQEFSDCYEPSWGRHKSRTRPSPGNHDYYTAGATGYYNYFGSLAGEAGKGYYSYDLGAWHIVSLNSEIDVGSGSIQEQWLRSDLAANPTTCTLAYWHKPKFSSGQHGNNVNMLALWQALYDYDADVVLGGHDHHYERFAPQSPSGNSDSERGLREFVIGTGGKSHYAASAIANSEVINTDTNGVLKLTLHSSDYEWEFVPEAGGSFTDSGSSDCH